MQINYELISPNGNITALVPFTKKDNYIAANFSTIAQKIIDKNPQTEQVGFVQKSEQGYQFQMAGGEFSGNGLRAAGYYFMKRFKTKNTFKVNVLNIGDLNILNDKNNQIWAQIPLPRELKTQKINQELTKIELLGTTNVIKQTSKLVSKKQLFKQTKEIMDQFNLWRKPGLAMIFLTNQPKTKIQVIYWVKDVKSLIYESACGSGSAAVAILKSLNLKSNNNMTIYQANGSVISTKIKFAKSTNTINSLYITGPINYLTSDKITINQERTYVK